MPVAQNQYALIRKQYLVTHDNVLKLVRLAAKQGTSATEIVRFAIDAYDPEGLDGLAPSELIDLLSDRLKEAIATTQNANQKVSNALKTMEKHN